MSKTAPPAPAEPVQDPTVPDKPAVEQPITGFKEKRARKSMANKRVVPLFPFEVIIGIDSDDYVFEQNAHDEQDALRQVIDTQPAMQARITTLRKLVTRKSWRPVNLDKLSAAQVEKIAASVSKLPDTIMTPESRKAALAELKSVAAPPQAKDDKPAKSEQPTAETKTDDPQAKDDKPAK